MPEKLLSVKSVVKKLPHYVHVYQKNKLWVCSCGKVWLFLWDFSCDFISGNAANTVVLDSPCALQKDIRLEQKFVAFFLIYNDWTHDFVAHDWNLWLIQKCDISMRVSIRFLCGLWVLSVFTLKLKKGLKIICVSVIWYASVSGANSKTIYIPFIQVVSYELEYWSSVEKWELLYKRPGTFWEVGSSSWWPNGNAD